jgi:hypothetical protein
VKDSRDLSKRSRREWSRRESSDIDEARRVSEWERANQSKPKLKHVPQCLKFTRYRNRSRRESNPHLRFRKPPFYPLNYGNNDIDLRFSTADCKLCRRISLVIAPESELAPPVGSEYRHRTKRQRLATLPLSNLTNREKSRIASSTRRTRTGP